VNTITVIFNTVKGEMTAILSEKKQPNDLIF